ncbi:MAG: WecB/TagA/CpsF family glycosyltransferase [Proteobacteria bacterium]|nr:WecB/TagA/CpsF family glycosyltransferase [Pseudomonadota bacterium]
MGYRVFSSNQFHLLDAITNWTAKGTYCRLLACINPHSYVVSLRDSEFSLALHGSDWLIPDGIGILIASRILGGRINQRITGSDVFHGLNSKLNNTGGKVFFLGSTEATLNAICDKVRLEWPGIRIAGTYSPPFKSEFSGEDNKAMLEAINAVAPDVLWVAMTAPKQEKWLIKNRQNLNVKFAGAVGAVFDFYTERVKRSHPKFQGLGLEWLPRLIQEPSRLWRRNFISTPKFLYRLAIERKIRRK